MDLNYKNFGAGEPLVILHGLFGMLDNWLSIAKKLAHRFDVYIIDQRNHGKSPHSEEHSYFLMARDLYDFLEEQNIYSAHLLGHSMGGKVVMQFATFYPGFVKKIIVADMFPKDYDVQRLEHQKIFEAMDIIDNCRFPDRKEAEDKLREIIDNERIFHFILKNLKLPKEGCPKWKFNSKVLRREFPTLSDNIKIVNQVKAPALFIKAGRSDYIDEKEFDSIKTFLPNAELSIMPEATHWLHADDPDLFLHIVNGFLLKNE